jgi:EAL domain-containing protein (putative c-di-GMP-specific phosphodiesterase class I)
MAAVRDGRACAMIEDDPEGGDLGDLVAGFNQMLEAVRAREAVAAGRVSELESALAGRDKALRLAEETAKSARQATAEFRASVSSDIAAPVRGVAAMAGRLSADDASSQQKRLAGVIARSGASLVAAVDDLLGLSGGELVMQAAPADPAEALEDVLSLFWEHARSKGLDLAAYIDPATPASIETDPVRLRQMIGLLVNSAINSTESGAVTVQAAPVGESLRVVVRGGPAAGGKVAGPGLAIAQRLAAAAGGRLSASSEAAKGQVFALDLPAVVLNPAASWPSASGVTAQVDIAAPATRASVVRYLKAAGFDVAAPGAADGNVGLHIGDAAVLSEGTSLEAPTICLGQLDAAAAQTLADAGRADLVLDQPLRRDELVAALAKVASGAPLRAPVEPARDQDSATKAAEAKPQTASLSPTTAAELLDPQVTGELARMAAAGKGDFVNRVRKLYRENAPAAVKAVIEASTNRDCEGAARAAQALKSMSLNMGARVVAESAARIEAQARDLGVVNVDQTQILHRQLLATLDVLEGYPPAPVNSLAGLETAPEEESLLSDLSHAIDNDELALVYQPQFDREGETITGIETLVRWNHATRGFVSPAFFIPIAERYGMIGRVTQWVLARAMRETADLGDFTISFNASAVEFADPAFVDELAVLIARHGFDPKRLEIEVTETAVLAEEDEVRRNMARLHELGLKIALDDFGVGYSSLSHLRLFPFDKLKIDRAFVIGCAENVQSATLVHAVVSIGRALGMKVIAEGVETEAQRKFLKVAGVHGMQGYLFAKPEPVEALRARLAALKAPEAISA